MKKREEGMGGEMMMMMKVTTDEGNPASPTTATTEDALQLSSRHFSDRPFHRAIREIGEFAPAQKKRKETKNAPKHVLVGLDCIVVC